MGTVILLVKVFPNQKDGLNQLVSQANATKTVFEEAKIIARTGWTTDELLAAIGEEELLPHYDLVF